MFFSNQFVLNVGELLHFIVSLGLKLEIFF